MDAEAKLNAVWAEAKPPACDPAFAVGIIERIERRQLWRRILLELVPFVAVMATAAWALAPAAEDIVTAALGQAADLTTTGAAVALSTIFGVGLASGTFRFRFV